MKLDTMDVLIMVLLQMVFWAILHLQHVEISQLMTPVSPCIGMRKGYGI